MVIPVALLNPGGNDRFAELWIFIDAVKEG
jgi:hypothetical protein